MKRTYFGIPTDPFPTFLSRSVPSDSLRATFQYNPPVYSSWTVAQVQTSSPIFSITFWPTSSARSFQTFSPIYGMWWNHSSGHFNPLPSKAFGYPLATHYSTLCMDCFSEQDTWSKVCTKRMGIFKPIRYQTRGKTTSRLGWVCRVATLHSDTARYDPFSVLKAQPDSLH